MEKVLVYAPISKDPDAFEPLPSLEEAARRRRWQHHPERAEKIIARRRKYKEKIIARRRKYKETERKWQNDVGERAVAEYLYYRYGIKADKKLGFGGQGSVWRAGQYAVKVLDPNMSAGGENEGLCTSRGGCPTVRTCRSTTSHLPSKGGQSTSWSS
ncbi:unnamed protein product [Vitrella brassicaformis CCMP3155]|uniref:Uncharacterized protein n=1 Tax=Vitrella brassicaformis (strain CCMP3155) TaxID=1169540 RepID=A0A0G4EEB7_VITBC|nr:unnamed protein product [Vitrella brassicaformis CCMP3155]|eukprot:CEL93899.1 unnamed protein product [Vitrella brassicaformis CCMP3155]